MRVKPILFNTEMVRAILDGRKTQTRRIVKPQPTNPRHNNVGWIGWDDGHGYRIKPPCEIGDVLWVRETWQYAYTYDYYDKAIEETGRYVYFADDTMPFNYWIDTDSGEHKDQMPWRPSIHMPREAARIFLRVTDVRVERLQDIDDDGVVAEGLEIGAQFDELWNRTVKKSDRAKLGWENNPWVWVIEFERCEKP